MNLYTFVASRVGSPEAQALSLRLAAWHDAMVAHDRRLSNGGTGSVCDDDCPHEEARLLWAEALAVFGDGAAECEFLRSHGEAGASPATLVPP